MSHENQKWDGTQKRYSKMEEPHCSTRSNETTCKRQASRTYFSITVLMLELQGYKKSSNFRRKKSHTDEQMLDQESQIWIPINPSSCCSYFLFKFIFPFHRLILISSILSFSQSEQDVLSWLWPERQGPGLGWSLSSYSYCNTNIKLLETCTEV